MIESAKDSGHCPQTPHLESESPPQTVKHQQSSPVEEFIQWPPPRHQWA